MLNISFSFQARLSGCFRGQTSKLAFDQALAFSEVERVSYTDLFMLWLVQLLISDRRYHILIL